MKLCDDFVTETVDNEHIMVAADSKRFSGLVRSNKTAAFIIEQLKTDVTREDIIQIMLQKFDAPRSVVERDVDMVLKNLRSIGALNE